MRRRLAGLAATALVLAGLSTPTSSAHADEPAPSGPPAGAPVTVADRVTLPADGSMSVDVLANDSDPDDATADDLTVCRAEPDPDVPVVIAAGVDYDETDYDTGGHPVLQVYPALAKPGTYTLTYYVCDYDYLSPATITVKVTSAERPYAEKISTRPGWVRFHNPGDRRAVFQFGALDGSSVDGKFALAAGGVKAVRVRRTEILWTATVRVSDGDSTYGGYVGDIEQPARVSRSVPRSPARTLADRSAWRLGLRAAQLRARGAGPSGAPAGSLLAQRDESTDAPVTEADSVDVPRGFFGLAQVLSNDSDPDGATDDLGICRASAPAGSGLDVYPLVGNGPFTIVTFGRGLDTGTDEDPVPYSLLVQPSREAKRGTYEVTYYACDHQYLTPGTLTVTVTKSENIVARKVADRPGVLRFTNPGSHGAVVEVFAVTREHGFAVPEDRPLLRFRLPGGASRNVRPRERRVMWFAYSRRGPGGWGSVSGLGRPRG